MPFLAGAASSLVNGRVASVHRGAEWLHTVGP